MASRDIWSHGSGADLRDLLSSSLAVLLLAPRGGQPAYFCSPWVTDFPLLENEFRQASALVPAAAGEPQIQLSRYLAALGRRREVRVVTADNPPSSRFAAKVRGVPGVTVRYADPMFHEKGLLTPLFYLEGSMNLTYNGVYVRGEKVTYHTPGDAEGAAKLARAYLEFNRLWGNLA